MNENKEVKYISIEDILPNRFQPRLAFGEKELNELAASIKQHGVLQPLLLRAIGDKYEIVAGERRYKASCIAGLNNVPCIIMDTDDNASAEIAITENIQRKDLTAIEEAQSYKKLLDRGKTQEEVAKKLGIAQSTVANKLRLLALTDEAQDALLNNKISERHARSLLRISDSFTQIEILNKIVNQKLTVRQTDDEINAVLGITKEENSVFEPLNTNVNIPNFESFLTPTVHDTKEEPVEEMQTKEIDIIEDTSEILTPFSAPDSFTLDESISEPINIEEDEENTEILEEPEVHAYTKTINETRNFINSLKEKGDITTEEFDFDDMYQIVIKIKKDE